MTSMLPAQHELFASIVDRINMGVVVVDKTNTVVLWNRFMASYSERSSEQVVGTSLFETYPMLPRTWLEQKLRNVFILKNFSFTTWENRPFLFAFNHNYPITGDGQNMRQNCTFIPIKNNAGEVEFVCIAIADVTETSMYESMLKDAVHSLEEMSSRDGLTGAFNRRHLEMSLSKEFSRAKRYGTNLSAIIMDIDFFKKINDTYGHKVGDEVLKAAATLVCETVREADICGRYGGEEFLAILPETDLQGAIILAERLRGVIESSEAKTEGKSIRFTVSVGVASIDESTNNHEQLVHNADMALYQSKKSQRNCVTAFQSDGFERVDKTPIPLSGGGRRVVFHIKVGHT